MLVLSLGVRGGDAHQAGYGRSALRVVGSDIEYRLESSGHDLALALGIETDLETPVPVSAFRARREDLRRYLSAHLRILSDDAVCRLRNMAVCAKTQGDWIIVSLAYQCPGPVRRLGLRYRLLFELDPDHQNVVIVSGPSGLQRALIDARFADVEFEVGSP